VRLEVTQLDQVGLAVGATAVLHLAPPGTVPPVGSAPLLGAIGGAWQAVGLGAGLEIAGGVLTLVGGGSGYSLPVATEATLGGVIIGSNLTISGGTLSLTKANAVAALGLTPVDAAGAAAAAPVQSVAGAIGAVALPCGMTVNWSQGVAPVAGTITLDGRLDGAVTITHVDHSVGGAGGSFEVALQIVSGGVPTTIGGLGAIEVDTASVTTVAATSANKGAAGHRLQLVISNVTGTPEGAFLRIRGTRP
jgi:hypothetical protein